MKDMKERDERDERGCGVLMSLCCFRDRRRLSRVNMRFGFFKCLKENVLMSLKETEAESCSQTPSQSEEVLKKNK